MKRNAIKCNKEQDEEIARLNEENERLKICIESDKATLDECEKKHCCGREETLTSNPEFKKLLGEISGDILDWIQTRTNTDNSLIIYCQCGEFLGQHYFHGSTSIKVKTCSHCKKEGVNVQVEAIVDYIYTEIEQTYDGFRTTTQEKKSNIRKILEES